MPSILALDEGTTSARAALYNERGERIAMRAIPFDCFYPHPGWVEQDATAIFSAQLEAVRAVLAWAETDLRTPRTVCMIDEGNARSIRVAAKCGYKEWRKTAYKGAPVTLFER